MTDMMLGLRDGDGADGPFWQRRGGPEAAVAGREAPGRGRRSRATVAPDWSARLAAYLRRLHPTKTAEAVSARCRGRISVEQVRKWLNRGSAPGGEALLWLATAYGPSLLVACFGPSPVAGGAPDWLAVAMRAEHVDDLTARLQALRTELDETLAHSR
ncbi:hypothetical protein ABE438_17565 [Bosea sp. TWI1241]|uniref:hypothetical protein n=1 Tax=Bosea sp. TWI1241 TaxID=3148904 RepID=UPI00320B39CD